MRTDYLSAQDAATRLGVNLATLYAYVSRGRIDSRPGPDGRTREYSASDIEQLIERKQAGRGAAQGAAHSLAWGLPVMETRISLIRPRGHYYRGESAMVLAKNGATLEETALLLWDCGGHDPFAVESSRRWPEAIAVLLRRSEAPPLERTIAALPLLALDATHAHSADPLHRRQDAALLLRETAALLCATQPSAQPIHQVMAASWRKDGVGLPELVRCALVLCADHELNASSFATRVAASTGASLHAAACAGLATLSGPHHGGAVARAHAFIQEMLRERKPVDRVRERLRRGETLPAFGHTLYPEGDPRGAVLLEALQITHPRPNKLPAIERLIDAVQAQCGLQPNVDFALAAVASAYELSADVALAIFAAGRMAGWLAHALEQQESGSLIRPRASYVGRMPQREG
ncbi:citrate synthase family protein [Dyella nitratireducens]|uniref:citrate synthase (unknown stereospecificity) n=1 Tax=Dyella nitratireducens TaxID=1849580 RepID=A0ABQ1GLX4_9GAMM|nr:citrate synthase family protein [Dyella nitratireducens]GGA45815.1 citrate synthase [Dyella nitratireducens]GLQ41367.1 citrate synthase [Dyella nitratireducens]